MRLRIALAAVSLALLVSAAPPAGPLVVIADPAAARICAKVAPRLAGSKIRLFNGPNGGTSFDLHQAVVRQVDGCIVPAIVRRDVDGRGTERPPARIGDTPRKSPNLVRPL